MLPYTTRDLIKTALIEDIGAGDITTAPLLSVLGEDTFAFEAKEKFILAGTDVVKEVFKEIDPTLEVIFKYKDGDQISPNTRIGTVKGKTACILTGERVALNFLQRLSGIATNTFNICTIMHNSRAGTSNMPVTKLIDTRKTTAGWRALEKYAVRVGGGCNHRFGLFDSILIKESHVDAAGGIDTAVRLIRGKAPIDSKIAIEVRTVEEAEQAVNAGADILFLDSLDLQDIVNVYKLINKRAKISLSVGSDMALLAKYAKLPVDFIAVGALTQNIQDADITLKLVNKK